MLTTIAATLDPGGVVKSIYEDVRNNISRIANKKIADYPDKKAEIRSAMNEELV